MEKVAKRFPRKRRSLDSERPVSLRRFPESVHRGLKAMAADRATTVEELMARAAREFLARNSKRKEEVANDGSDL